jgi:hypothetical protein
MSGVELKTNRIRQIDMLNYSFALRAKKKEGVFNSK